MTRLVLGLLLVALVAGPALAAGPPVEVGRIDIIDGNEGFVIAEFPSGRRLISVDKRYLWLYRVGGEIHVDAFGRPLLP